MLVSFWATAACDSASRVPETIFPVLSLTWYWKVVVPMCDAPVSLGRSAG